MKESFKNRAIENIKAAELAFDNNFFNATANRAYFAAFHATLAAIYSLGIEPKIEHRTIQTIFSDNFFNRRKVIPSKYKRILGDLQDKRNTADYKAGISKKVAKEQLKNAQELIEIILKVIK